jgi:hypothetical protein
LRAVAPDGATARVFLSFLATAGLFYVNIMPAIVDGLIEGMGFTSRQAGYVGSANVYGAAAGALLIVFLVRRLRWRPAAYTLLLMLIGMDLVSLLVSTPALLVGVRFVHGLVGGALVGVAFAVIARASLPDRTFGVLLVVQFGLGGVPNAVARSLRSHRDLGIHTEMFVDAMFDLIEAGVVTGSQKTFHPGKAVYTFAAGSQRMYAFLDDNPYVEAHPVDYTNHPAQIARNANMISVNSTIEVDLTGQCCSESVGPAQWSGTGGQLDYVRGAYDAPGGKSIIAFYSTAKGGTVSRVVPTLTPGAAVTTPRTDVHWLVTEHGAVNLKGRSTRDRARALIGLAAPQFRDDLERAGRDLGYLRD